MYERVGEKHLSLPELLFLGAALGVTTPGFVVLIAALTMITWPACAYQP